MRGLFRDHLSRFGGLRPQRATLFATIMSLNVSRLQAVVSRRLMGNVV
jgi:hypothetical protein